MVIFHSYVSLPEGNGLLMSKTYLSIVFPVKSNCFRMKNPNPSANCFQVTSTPSRQRKRCMGACWLLSGWPDLNWETAIYGWKITNMVVLRWFNRQQTGIYMGFTWDLHGIFMGFTWDLHGIYMGFTWNLHGIYMGFTWDLVGLTLQQTNIAMENGLFVDDLPMKNTVMFYTIAMPDE